MTIESELPFLQTNEPTWMKSIPEKRTETASTSYMNPPSFFLFSLELETVTQRRWVIPISSVCTKHHFAPPVSKLWWLNTHLIIWSVVSHGFWRPGPSPMALDVIPGACWFRWSCSALSLCAACAPCPCLKQSRYPTSSGQMAAKEKRSAGFVIEELMGIIW